MSDNDYQVTGYNPYDVLGFGETDTDTDPGNLDGAVPKVLDDLDYTGRHPV